MQAEIINGILVVIPSNETENYALNQWHDSAVMVRTVDALTLESVWIRGSRLKITGPVIKSGNCDAES